MAKVIILISGGDAAPRTLAFDDQAQLQNKDDFTQEIERLNTLLEAESFEIQAQNAVDDEISLPLLEGIRFSIGSVIPFAAMDDMDDSPKELTNLGVLKPYLSHLAVHAKKLEINNAQTLQNTAKRSTIEFKELRGALKAMSTPQQNSNQAENNDAAATVAAQQQEIQTLKTQMASLYEQISQLTAQQKAPVSSSPTIQVTASESAQLEQTIKSLQENFQKLDQETIVNAAHAWLNDRFQALQQLYIEQQNEINAVKRKYARAFILLFGLLIMAALIVTLIVLTHGLATAPTASAHTLMGSKLAQAIAEVKGLLIASGILTAFGMVLTLSSISEQINKLFFHTRRLAKTDKKIQDKKAELDYTELPILFLAGNDREKQKGYQILRAILVKNEVDIDGTPAPERVAHIIKNILQGRDKPFEKIKRSLPKRVIGKAIGHKEQAGLIEELTPANVEVAKSVIQSLIKDIPMKQQPLAVLLNTWMQHQPNRHNNKADNRRDLVTLVATALETLETSQERLQTLESMQALNPQNARSLVNLLLQEGHELSIPLSAHVDEHFLPPLFIQDMLDAVSTDGGADKVSNAIQSIVNTKHYNPQRLAKWLQALLTCKGATLGYDQITLATIVLRQTMAPEQVIGQINPEDAAKLLNILIYECQEPFFSLGIEMFNNIPSVTHKQNADAILRAMSEKQSIAATYQLALNVRKNENCDSGNLDLNAHSERFIKIPSTLRNAPGFLNPKLRPHRKARYQMINQLDEANIIAHLDGGEAIYNDCKNLSITDIHALTHPSLRSKTYQAYFKQIETAERDNLSGYMTKQLSNALKNSNENTQEICQHVLVSRYKLITDASIETLINTVQNTLDEIDPTQQTPLLGGYLDAVIALELNQAFQLPALERLSQIGNAQERQHTIQKASAQWRALYSAQKSYVNNSLPYSQLIARFLGTQTTDITVICKEFADATMKSSVDAVTKTRELTAIFNAINIVDRDNFNLTDFVNEHLLQYADSDILLNAFYAASDSEPFQLPAMLRLGQLAMHDDGELGEPKIDDIAPLITRIEHQHSIVADKEELPVTLTTYFERLFRSIPQEDRFKVARNILRRTVKSNNNRSSAQDVTMTREFLSGYLQSRYFILNRASAANIESDIRDLAKNAAKSSLLSLYFWAQFNLRDTEWSAKNIPSRFERFESAFSKLQLSGEPLNAALTWEKHSVSAIDNSINNHALPRDIAGNINVARLAKLLEYMLASQERQAVSKQLKRWPYDLNGKPQSRNEVMWITQRSEQLRKQNSVLMAKTLRHLITENQLGDVLSKMAPTSVAALVNTLAASIPNPDKMHQKMLASVIRSIIEHHLPKPFNANTMTQLAMTALNKAQKNDEQLSALQEPYNLNTLETVLSQLKPSQFSKLLKKIDPAVVDQLIDQLGTEAHTLITKITTHRPEKRSKLDLLLDHLNSDSDQPGLVAIFLTLMERPVDSHLPSPVNTFTIDGLFPTSSTILRDAEATAQEEPGVRLISNDHDDTLDLGNIVSEASAFIPMPADDFNASLIGDPSNLDISYEDEANPSLLSSNDRPLSLISRPLCANSLFKRNPQAVEAYQVAVLLHGHTMNSAFTDHPQTDLAQFVLTKEFEKFIAFENNSDVHDVNFQTLAWQVCRGLQMILRHTYNMPRESAVTALANVFRYKIAQMPDDIKANFPQTLYLNHLISRWMSVYASNYIHSPDFDLTAKNRRMDDLLKMTEAFLDVSQGHPNKIYGPYYVIFTHLSDRQVEPLLNLLDPHANVNTHILALRFAAELQFKPMQAFHSGAIHDMKKLMLGKRLIALSNEHPQQLKARLLEARQHKLCIEHLLLALLEVRKRSASPITQNEVNALYTLLESTDDLNKFIEISTHSKTASTDFPVEFEEHLYPPLFEALSQLSDEDERKPNLNELCLPALTKLLKALSFEQLKNTLNEYDRFKSGKSPDFEKALKKQLTNNERSLDILKELTVAITQEKTVSNDSLTIVIRAFINSRPSPAEACTLYWTHRLEGDARLLFEKAFRKTLNSDLIAGNNSSASALTTTLNNNILSKSDFDIDEAAIALQHLYAHSSETIDSLINSETDTLTACKFILTATHIGDEKTVLDITRRLLRATETKRHEIYRKFASNHGDSKVFELFKKAYFGVDNFTAPALTASSFLYFERLQSQFNALSVKQNLKNLTELKANLFDIYQQCKLFSKDDDAAHKLFLQTIAPHTQLESTEAIPNPTFERTTRLLSAIMHDPRPNERAALNKITDAIIGDYLTENRGRVSVHAPEDKLKKLQRWANKHLKPAQATRSVAQRFFGKTQAEAKTKTSPLKIFYDICQAVQNEVESHSLKPLMDTVLNSASRTSAAWQKLSDNLTGLISEVNSEEAFIKQINTLMPIEGRDSLRLSNIQAKNAPLARAKYLLKALAEYSGTTPEAITSNHAFMFIAKNYAVADNQFNADRADALFEYDNVGQPKNNNYNDCLSQALEAVSNQVPASTASPSSL